MKNLKKAQVENKKILVRCDFNVPIEDGVVTDDYRIIQSLPTVKNLVSRGAKVILISHRGRPKKKKKFNDNKLSRFLKDFLHDDDLSLEPVVEVLKSNLEEVSFIHDCVGSQVEKRVNKMKPGEVILLENLRYYEGEEAGNDQFSKKLAELADIYVNNAFSASHRDHASITGVTDFLTSYPGYLFRKEVKFLTRLKERPDRPLVVIVGGAKISSKIKTIKHFMKRADSLLVGGKVANSILALKGVVDSHFLPDRDLVEKLEDLNLTSTKLNLPVDVVASSDHESYLRHTSIGKVRKNEEIFDIGPETVDLYADIIREAGTIVWAGPLGFFENSKFEKGTRAIGRRVAENEEALTVIGGGDTGAAFNKFGLRRYVDHVSLGGGAMLNFLSDGEMPGLNALEK